MSNYIPGDQKKSKIFKKREVELIHAIKNNFSIEKKIKAAEKLREAKLQSIKLQSKVNRASSEKWNSYSVEEIIEMYSKQKPNQALNQTPESNGALRGRSTGGAG